jgi:hypothetical protein
MKRILTALFLLGLVSLSYAVNPPCLLSIDNNGFETGTLGNFTVYNATMDRVTSDQSFTGIYSAQLHKRGPADEWMRRYNMNLTNAVYVMWKAKSNVFSDENKIEFAGVNGTYDTVYRDNYTSSWLTYTRDIPAKHATGNTSIYFYKATLNVNFSGTHTCSEIDNPYNCTNNYDDIKVMYDICPSYTTTSTTTTTTTTSTTTTTLDLMTLGVYAFNSCNSSYVPNVTVLVSGGPLNVSKFNQTSELGSVHFYDLPKGEYNLSCVGSGIPLGSHIKNYTYALNTDFCDYNCNVTGTTTTTTTTTTVPVTTTIPPCSGSYTLFPSDCLSYTYESTCIAHFYFSDTQLYYQCAWIYDTSIYENKCVAGDYSKDQCQYYPSTTTTTPVTTTTNYGFCYAEGCGTACESYCTARYADATCTIDQAISCINSCPVCIVTTSTTTTIPNTEYIPTTNTSVNCNNFTGMLQTGQIFQSAMCPFIMPIGVEWTGGAIYLFMVIFVYTLLRSKIATLIIGLLIASVFFDFLPQPIRVLLGIVVALVITGVVFLKWLNKAGGSK